MEITLSYTFIHPRLIEIVLMHVLFKFQDWAKQGT